MFGWVALVLTGYAQGHGLIPNADLPLDVSDWGSLALLDGSAAISNERAVILIAHVHALFVSICAAFAPLSFQDKLFLEKDETPEPAAGLFPPLEPGLTKNAELWNGRVAMLGLIVTIAASLANGEDMISTINTGLGGLLIP